MQQTLKQVLNNAKFVKFHPKVDNLLAVWKGGHTVNFYRVIENDYGTFLREFTCINVGDFAKESATLQEVKEGIESHFEREV